MPAGECGVVMVIPHAVLAVVGVIGLSTVPGQEGLWVPVTVLVYTIHCLVIYTHINLATRPAEIGIGGNRLNPDIRKRVLAIRPHLYGLRLINNRAI